MIPWYHGIDGIPPNTSLRVRVEPRGLYQHQRWTDIVIPDLQGGQNFQLDFYATHPCLPPNVATASTSPRSSCSQEGEREEGGLQDCAGMLLPLVVEHHGRWGKSAIHLLNSLAKKAGDSLPGVTQGQFHDFWVKQLGYELVRSVAFTVVLNTAGWFQYTHHIGELQHALSCFLIIFHYNILGYLVHILLFVCLCFKFLYIHTYI